MDIRKKNALLAIIIGLIALLLYVASILKFFVTSPGQ
jgi:preprotein translocase subunit SecF